MVILRNVLSKNILVGFIFCMLAASVNGQELGEIKSIDDLPDEVFANFKENFIAQRRASGSDKIDLDNLQGSFQVTASCPTGYVKKANYRFSLKDIEVTEDYGADCDDTSCRSWHVAATPLTEETYTFKMNLQCTNDDLITRDSFKSKPVARNNGNRGAGE